MHHRVIERHAAAILSAAADAVVIFPVDGKILDFNDAAARIFGFSERNLGEHLKEYLVDPPHEQARHMVKLGEPLEMTARNVEGVRFPVDLVVVLISGTEPSLFAAFIRNIDKRKEIEAQLAKARDAAEAANRAKTSFFSSISHEVRTPLSVITGLVEILEDTDLTADQRQLLREIRGSSELLLRLIDELLDLTKLETGQIDFVQRPFFLGGLVEGACRLVRQQAAGKGLELQTSARDTGEALLGDPDRLQEILVNLLSNGVKFSERGRVCLEAEIQDAAEGLRQLRFTVTDTGAGIAPEHRERIFDRFFRAPGAASSGSGLGLSIAASLAYMMGGRLWLEASELGGGSMFRFEINLPVAPARPEEGSRSLPPAGFQARVLLAEDHEPNRRIFVRFLETGGHSVEVATNGLEAEARAREKDYDLVLLDVEMPGLDGIEVARRIRGIEVEQGRQPASIVALTAYPFRDFRQRYLGAGINHYLVKPVSRETLLSKIASILADRHRPLPETGSETPILVPVDPEISDLVEDFLADLRRGVEEMAVYLERGEAERVGIFAHNLRGSAGAYGFHELTPLGSTLQQAAGAGDLRTSREVLREVASYLRRVQPVM